MLCLAVTHQVWALRTESFGPADEHMGSSGDWAKGVEEVLRHPSRVYCTDTNGSEQAYYDGDIKTVNELLALFGQIDIAAHEVVIRPGRPSAKSFDGQMIPYAVEFYVPGRISQWYTEPLRKTGLFPGTPRLIIHVNDWMVEHLDELKVPENVSLLERPYRVDDALAQMDAKDRSLRGRAIRVLGESGDASPAVIEALKRAATDDNDDKSE